MFERVWIYNTWYTHEALMADDAAWSAAELAHGVCEQRRKRTLAPSREEEEARLRKSARNSTRHMAEALFVAGMRSVAPAEMPDARSPTPHWDAETDTFSWPAETDQIKPEDDYDRQSLTGW